MAKTPDRNANLPEDPAPAAHLDKHTTFISPDAVPPPLEGPRHPAAAAAPAVDPLVPAVAADGTVTLSAALLAQLLERHAASAAAPAAPGFDMKAFAEAITLANRKEGHSNPTHPGVSAYNPLGERDHPRPEFGCKTYFGAYELNTSTMTLEEITLVNDVPEGRYLVLRSDDSYAEMTIEIRRDRITGTPERKTIAIKAGDQEENKNWLPLRRMLRDALDADVQRTFRSQARAGAVSMSA